MIDQIERIQVEAQGQISKAPDSNELERLRVHYLGKKGVLTSLLHQLKDFEPEKRKELGAVLNKIKTDFEREFFRRSHELTRAQVEDSVKKAPPLDVTLPGYSLNQMGSLHPVTRVIQETLSCLRQIGFSVANGPEIETEYYNFEALNIPDGHPARDMQDTFYINPPALLRTHTSPVQIRAMKTRKPPIQMIAIGRVYRSDYDVTHTPMFHQVEGLMVDTNISLADLKGVLQHLVKHIFGVKHLRLRPSYFPFTEPSGEVDMQCVMCRGSGKDCRLCKSTGWLEIGGCGMVHPNVFKAVNYDTDTYTGFAFGMGIERMAMLKYGIDDLRSLFENDYRMLEQF